MVWMLSGIACTVYLIIMNFLYLIIAIIGEIRNQFWELRDDVREVWKREH